MEPSGNNWGLITWVLSALWVVAAAAFEGLRRLYGALNRRAIALEQRIDRVDAEVDVKFSEVSRKVDAADHDLKGVRQNQKALEEFTRQRHTENDRRFDRIENLITDGFDMQGTRIDRLFERSGDRHGGE